MRRTTARERQQMLSHHRMPIISTKTAIVSLDREYYMKVINTWTCMQLSRSLVRTVANQ